LANVTIYFRIVNYFWKLQKNHLRCIIVMSTFRMNLESFGAKTQKLWLENRLACKVWRKIVQVFRVITLQNIIVADKFRYLIEIFCLRQGELCTLLWFILHFKNIFFLWKVVDFENIKLSLKAQCYTLKFNCRRSHVVDYRLCIWEDQHYYMHASNDCCLQT